MHFYLCMQNDLLICKYSHIFMCNSLTFCLLLWNMDEGCNSAGMTGIFLLSHGLGPKLMSFLNLKLITGSLIHLNMSSMLCFKDRNASDVNCRASCWNLKISCTFSKSDQTWKRIRSRIMHWIYISLSVACSDFSLLCKCGSSWELGQRS